MEGQLGGTDVFEAKDKSLKQSVNSVRMPHTENACWVLFIKEVISDLYQSSFTVMVRPEAKLPKLES